MKDILHSRPSCPLGWACKYFSVEVSDAILRQVLEALCERDTISLESAIEPGQPARNFELASRLGISHVFSIAGMNKERI